MTDHILAVLSLAGLAVFLAVLIWFLQEVDLTIVAVGAVALAAYDFFVYKRRNNSGQ